ncbi:uracil-DNA glycosylase [Palleronia sediminis]|uniref:Uracil-DNA glycosylase n=1 Tax=Palleronia sediminis TaxID=2547833 RepID=A0A4R6AGS6_9RHOB|nr:uracil-DNA glycosylase [Palleronia sediminis]
MDPAEYHDALACLEWQVELGADEAICETPVDRYAAAHAAAEAKAAAAAAPPVADAPRAPDARPDPAAQARAVARAAADLEGLRHALAAFEGIEAKQGARNLVFSDGDPGAPVMVVGEAPDRDEDNAGHPFAGAPGALLDRMFAAIGMSRAGGDIYLAAAMPWRLPQTRDAEPDEIAAMQPFLERHIALADPRIVVAMGNLPCRMLLGRDGIGRLRGGWTEALGRPVLPMLSPAHLLRVPAAKRDAWADLLALAARIG